VFCRSLIVLFLLAIVLSVLQFKDSDYSCGIFKLFLFTKINHNNLTSFSTIFNTHNLKHILMSNILCISVRENRRGHPDLVNWETWATLESIFKQRQKTKETHTQQRKLNRWATRTTKISGKDPGTREGSAFPASYKTRQITHKVTTCWTPLRANKHKPHNKSWHLLQRNGSWAEPNVVFMRKS
jgi:hypothetical protein